MKAIFDIQFEHKQDLLDNVIALEKKRGLRLLTNDIRKQTELTRVQSWHSEMNFGLLFDPFCEELKYDQKFDLLTPDWTIQNNGQKIIAEVLKLNPPNEQLLEGYEQAKQFQEINKNNPYAISYKGPVTLDSKYFYGHQGKLKAKEEKYRDVIKKYQLPFVICMQSHLDTFVSELDASDFLMGKWGFFNTDRDFQENVSAVILIDYFSKRSFFNNEKCLVPLNEDNISLFTKHTQA